MNDLLVPIYLVMNCDEAETFWAFQTLMEKMVQTVENHERFFRIYLTAYYAFGISKPTLLEINKACICNSKALSDCLLS
jgi:hypothetical protein